MRTMAARHRVVRRRGGGEAAAIDASRGDRRYPARLPLSPVRKATSRALRLRVETAAHRVRAVSQQRRSPHDRSAARCLPPPAAPSCQALQRAAAKLGWSRIGRHPAENRIDRAIDQHRLGGSGDCRHARGTARILLSADRPAASAGGGSRDPQCCRQRARWRSGACSRRQSSQSRPSRVTRTDRMPVAPSSPTGATTGSTHAQRSDGGGIGRRRIDRVVDARSCLRIDEGGIVAGDEYFDLNAERLVIGLLQHRAGPATVARRRVRRSCRCGTCRCLRAIRPRAGSRPQGGQQRQADAIETSHRARDPRHRQCIQDRRRPAPASLTQCVPNLPWRFEPYVWATTPATLTQACPMARAFLFVLDSFGIGGAADAARFRRRRLEHVRPYRRRLRGRQGGSRRPAAGPARPCPT